MGAQGGAQLRGLRAARPAYQQILRRSLSEFKGFLHPFRVPFSVLSENSSFMSEALSQFVEACFESGPSRFHIAKHAILAVQHVHPNLRGCLRPAWDTLRRWQLQLPSKNRVPLPHRVLLAMTGACILNAAEACAEERRVWFCLHLFLLVAFSRPFEASRILQPHIRGRSGTAV